MLSISAPCQAALPPVGSDVVNTLPMSSTAAQKFAVGQDSPSKPIVAGDVG